MKTGEKIKKYRLMSGMTQKELGQKIGFSAATSDSRIRKYESCQMAPKDDIRQKMADALDVDITALSDIDIRQYEDIMRIFFFLEEEYGMRIERTQEKTCLVFDNRTNISTVLDSYLYTWNAQKKKCDQAIDEVKEEAEAQYDRWKARFPKDLEAYWDDQAQKLDAFYKPYIQSFKASREPFEYLSDLIVQLRKLIKNGITVDADTKLNAPGDGALILTFRLSELLNSESTKVCKAFAGLLCQISVLEENGMPLSREFFTTECGTQVSYCLGLAPLMALKSTIMDIQRFESNPDNNDWDSDLFEMSYEDTLNQYKLNVKTEVQYHY